MRPIANNFTGTFKNGTRYRIKVANDTEKLTVTLETLEKGQWHYQMSEVSDMAVGYSTALVNALKNAQNAWGIKLLGKELKDVA